MTPGELLQQLGLNKYEAEAYYTLLREGALTGYEVAKHSPIPLSRSYEVLERLVYKGLALVQLGNPPRYVAADAPTVLAQARTHFTHTLDALAAALADLPRADPAWEFWVLRGRRPILAHTGRLIAEAQHEVCLTLPTAEPDELAPSVAAARTRGCWIVQQPVTNPADLDGSMLLLLVDGQQGLAGLLAPPERCQAVTTTHPALVAALTGYFAPQARRSPPAPPAASLLPLPLSSQQDASLAWLAWDERKHRQLWRLRADGYQAS